MHNVNLMEILIKCVNCILSTNKIINSSKNPRQSRRNTLTRKRMICNNEKLVNILNIIKYIKENKLSDFNPLQIKFFTNLNKNKSYNKKILLFLLKLSFPISDEFKKEIIEKIFNKLECKTLDKILSTYKFDNLKSDIKSIIKSKQIYKKSKQIYKKSNQIAYVGAIDDLDSDSDQMIPDNEIDV